MAEEEDIVVTVEDEPKTGTEDAVVKVEEPKVEAKDSAIDDLAKQYKELEEREANARKAEETARRRAEESERAAQEALRQAEAAKAQARTSNLDTITTALASANAEVEAAKRDVKIAGEAGDYEAQAAAYERLAGAKALVLRYDEAKADLETRRPEPQQQRRPADPVEAYIAGRSEPTQQWLRSHTDYITDQKKNAKLNAAHHDAMAEGHAPDSDGYFAHVEKFLGMGETEKAESKPKRPAARVAAPTSAANGTPSGGANEVRLTPGEARAATDGTLVWNWDDTSPKKAFKKGDPIGIKEMARRKQAMAKDGAYDRTYEVQ